MAPPVLPPRYVRARGTWGGVAFFIACCALSLGLAVWVSYTAGHRKGAFEERLKCLGEANE